LKIKNDENAEAATRATATIDINDKQIQVKWE
jgi:hypothetical protein